MSPSPPYWKLKFTAIKHYIRISIIISSFEENKIEHEIDKITTNYRDFNIIFVNFNKIIFRCNFKNTNV